jgi:hypothetical protein
MENGDEFLMKIRDFRVKLIAETVDKQKRKTAINLLLQRISGPYQL